MNKQTPIIRRNEIVQSAQKRLSAHAAINRNVPPSTIIDPDGGPSQELMDYCDKHDLTLDWALLGEGVKSRSGLTARGRSMTVSSSAYELSGLVETCRMAFSNDGLPLPKECWGIGQTLDTAARMAGELIEAVELLEFNLRLVSKPIETALETVADARQRADAAVTRFNELDAAGGVGNAEAQAFEVASVHPAQDVAGVAEMELLNTQSETVGDFLRKVSTLCREGEMQEVYDGIRNEADRLIEKFG